MRSKILVSVLIIALAVALLAGATGAWFTDDVTLGKAEFKAGTLAINADREPDIETMPNRSIDNVNPGDCATVCWDITNTGSKKAELRVKLDGKFADEDLTDEGVVFFAPVKDSKWVLYEGNDEDDDEGLWLYYTGGPVDGTYGDVEGETVPLCLIVAFDGENMKDEYQRAVYTINGEVQAVQASNDAPEAVWGNVWTTVTGEDYAPEGLALEYLEYIMETDCWEGKYPTVEGVKVNVVVLMRDESLCAGVENQHPILNTEGEVTGAGTHAVGSTVLLSAINPIKRGGVGSNFIGWFDSIGNNHVTGWITNANPFKYTVPNGVEEVTIYAVYAWGLPLESLGQK